jgi:hypothetical protein
VGRSVRGRDGHSSQRLRWCRSAGLDSPLLRGGGRNGFAGELHGMGTHACPRGGGLVTFGRGAAPVTIVQKLDAVD